MGKRETFGTSVSLDGYEEDGNPPALGVGNTAFDSRVPDMLDSNWRKSSRSQNTNCLEARWKKSSYSSDSSCLEARWKKSSRSAAGDGNCVEALWHKSTRCDSNTCIETRTTKRMVEVRDSKDPEGPTLSFTTSQWQDFIDFLKVRTGK